MLMYYFYSLVSLFISGLYIYVVKYKHFLLMLLSLEFIVLSLFMFMFLFLFQHSFEYFVSMIYLTMSVCEGALGLSLLVLLVRTHSKDLIFIFDNLW